jgi:hypothetical protein
LWRNSGENSGFGNSAGADAVGADSHAFVGLSDKHANTLKVRIPAPPRQIMSVADPVSVNRAFIADFTARHEAISLNY